MFVGERGRNEQIAFRDSILIFVPHSKTLVANAAYHHVRSFALRLS